MNVVVLLFCLFVFVSKTDDSFYQWLQLKWCTVSGRQLAL